MDAPGVCRRPCQGNDGCAADQYCSQDALCRDDASCWTPEDCGLDGNDWPAPMCVGYATCPQWTKTCEWNCGDGPTCLDLGEVMFGLCEAIVGYGVINGGCEAISGCSDQGYPLFDDLQDCYLNCLPDQLPK